MMKFLVTLLVTLLVAPLWSQIATVAESDTTYGIDALTSLRYNLFDDDSTDARWSNAILRDYLNQSLRDVAAKGMIEKLDTIITGADTVIYQLNADFMEIKGALVKTAQERWSSLYMRPVGGTADKVDLYGRDGDKIKVYSFHITDKFILIDSPPPSGGDSLILIYSAYSNDLTDATGNGPESTIVNVPFELQNEVIEGAMLRALRANRETK